MSETNKPTAVSVRYRDERGETSWRRIMPGRAWESKTLKGKRWMLHVRDLEQQVDCDLALANIVEWRDGP